jgi:hypothetical protein
MPIALEIGIATIFLRIRNVYEEIFNKIIVDFRIFGKHKILLKINKFQCKLSKQYAIGRIESARIEIPVVLNGHLVLLEHVL